MPDGAGKSKCTFRRTVAPEHISASELDTAERLLTRFVALAYAGEHPDLFTPSHDPFRSDYYLSLSWRRLCDADDTCWPGNSRLVAKRLLIDIWH